MPADFRTLEWPIIVLHPLKDFFLDLAILSERHAIDVLNVSGASPTRHERIRSCAAIFIAKKYAVLQYFVGGLVEALVPHHHWNVGEVAQRIRPGVNNRGIFDSLVFGIACGDRPHVHHLHFEACAGSGPARASLNV